MTLALHLLSATPDSTNSSPCPLSCSFFPRTPSFLFSILRTPHSRGRNSPLCFHALTKCFSRNPFLLIIMQTARGYTQVRSTTWTINIEPPETESLAPATRALCSLFTLLCTRATANSRAFSRLRTLWKNHPGGGRGLMTPTSAPIRSKQALRRGPFRFKIKPERAKSEPLRNALRRET